MKYDDVCIEAFGYTLPDESVTSEDLEKRLDSLYRRFELSSGLLSAMSGIRQRRIWAPGTRPSEKSIESAEKAISAAGIQKSDIGAIVNGSVCREFVEPATACIVHSGLGLSNKCQVYDVTNACLGILNGMVQVANMIELGQIRAGLVVGTESSRELLDNTIEHLNSNQSLTREQVNGAIASLTIGSGSVAVLLVHRNRSKLGNRLVVATSETNSVGHARCRTERDQSLSGRPAKLMETDSARLVEEAIALATSTFNTFLDESGWTRANIDRTFCHQAGARPRKLLLNALQLDPACNFATFEEFGNIAAVSIPLAMALAVEQRFVTEGSRVALIGTGAGINAQIVGVEWRRNLAERANTD